MMADVRWAMGDERFDMYAFENQRRLLDFWKIDALLEKARPFEPTFSADINDTLSK